MITVKEAYPGMCGLIGWIKENDAFCKKNEVWDLQLLQSRLAFHLPVGMGDKSNVLITIIF